MILPFLALYLTQDLNWSKTQAAVATSCFGFGNLAGAIIGGWLVDRFPSLKIMFWSLVFGGLCFVGLTWVKSFYEICIWLFISVTVADLMRPAAMVAISNFSDDTTVTRAISLLRLTINLGIAIGPAIGGILIGILGYDIIFIIDGITCVVAGLFLYYIFNGKLGSLNQKEKVLKQNTNIKTEAVSAYTDIYFLAFLFCNLAMLTVFFQFFFTVPLYLTEHFSLSEFQIGLYFAINGAVIFIFEMPVIFAFEQRKLLYKPLIFGVIIIGLSYVFWMLNNLSVWLTIFLFNLVLGLGEIISFPFISTSAILRGNEANKGSYVGTVNAMFSVAFILAPLIFLPFVDELGYQLIWILCMVISVLAGFGLWILKPYFKAQTDG